jgi:hypothetical protein
MEKLVPEILDSAPLTSILPKLAVPLSNISISLAFIKERLTSI